MHCGPYPGCCCLCLCPGPAWDNAQGFVLEGKCFLEGAEHLAAFPASSWRVAGHNQGLALGKPMPQQPPSVRVWLCPKLQTFGSSVKRLQQHPQPASHAALPVWGSRAEWSRSSQACTRVVKREKDCAACQPSFLPLPAPNNTVNN